MKDFFRINKPFKKYLPVYMIMLSIMLLLGTSYALLRSSHQGENSYVMNVGTLEITFVDSQTSALTLENAKPVTDEEGEQEINELVFTVKNTGNVDAKYSVYIEETSTSPEFKTVIRFISNKNDTGYTDPKTLSADKYIDQYSYLKVGKTVTYKVKAWLSETADSTYMNKTFTARIVVDVIQIKDLDISGANKPELLDNMIPVYYEATSDTEGVWKKADSTNTNPTYKWHDYTNFMWANAVTVKESGTKSRSQYLSSAVGTVISMDDITTMWVWIPRYKYTIWSANNGTSEEQLIKVEFEEGTSTTGTVTCVDNILTSDTSSSSETCTDSTNGSIVNGTSTYTHPAFTFGDDELTGIWYAKFEMSTDQDSTCVTSASTDTCNIIGQNIYVKPDQISLRHISNSNMFVNIRNMELFNNVHGFVQNTSATTSSSQTGEIVNDNNDYDIHMQKNMEWGAATYLAYSKYGKYGNSLYTGTNKRVYKNNWFSIIDNVYTYKAGYSGYSYNPNYSTSNTVLYNDLTDLGSGQGYKGAGASTTGTIYGIYDMSGGAYDRTMGNMVNNSGNFYSSDAEFSSNPLAKYYDKYSYSSTDYSSQTSISRGKLGDATKEMTKGFTDSTGSWEESYRRLSYSYVSWLARGGGSANPSNLGLTNTSTSVGDANRSNSSRPVLVRYHNFLQ